jgi:hypothetical protein
MHPVWWVSFRVEVPSILKMEADHLKVFLDHEFGKIFFILLPEHCHKSAESKTGKDAWGSQEC